MAALDPAHPAGGADPRKYRLMDRQKKSLSSIRFLLRLGRHAFPAAAVSLAAAAVEQPIEFPHNKHAALNLECVDCHTQADIGDAATIPSIRQCMLCHEKIAADRPEIQKLASFAEAGREPPWVRIYRFNRSGHVIFRHAPHFRAGIRCADCHGDMSAAVTAQPLVKHTMGTCLDCHREQKASEDCSACHN